MLIERANKNSISDEPPPIKIALNPHSPYSMIPYWRDVITDTPLVILASDTRAGSKVAMSAMLDSLPFHARDNTRLKELYKYMADWGVRVMQNFETCSAVLTSEERLAALKNVIKVMRCAPVGAWVKQPDENGADSSKHKKAPFSRTQNCSGLPYCPRCHYRRVIALYDKLKLMGDQRVVSVRLISDAPRRNVKRSKQLSQKINDTLRHIEGLKGGWAYIRPIDVPKYVWEDAEAGIGSFVTPWAVHLLLAVDRGRPNPKLPFEGQLIGARPDSVKSGKAQVFADRHLAGWMPFDHPAVRHKEHAGFYPFFVRETHRTNNLIERKGTEQLYTPGSVKAWTPRQKGVNGVSPRASKSSQKLH